MVTKKEEIDRFFYNEDGTFKSLTDLEGNISGKLAHLRNTYMEAEREYFTYLLSDKSNRDMFETLLKWPSEDLFAYATELQERLENGMLENEEDKAKMAYMSPEGKDRYHMQKLEFYEAFICLLFAATRDATIFRELIRSSSSKEKEGRGR